MRLYASYDWTGLLGRVGRPGESAPENITSDLPFSSRQSPTNKMAGANEDRTSYEVGVDTAVCNIQFLRCRFKGLSDDKRSLCAGASDLRNICKGPACFAVGTLTVTARSQKAAR